MCSNAKWYIKYVKLKHLKYRNDRCTTAVELGQHHPCNI